MKIIYEKFSHFNFSTKHILDKYGVFDLAKNGGKIHLNVNLAAHQSNILHFDANSVQV